MTLDYIEVTEAAMLSLSSKDPILGAYIQKVGPLRRDTLEDPYVSTLDCIIAQQVSGKAAQSIGSKVFARFPQGDPKGILEASEEEMRALGLSRSKINYLKNVAQTKVEQRIDWDKINTLSTQEIIVTLLPIKGVGLWTIQMVLIFSLRRMDVMSYDDLAIRRGIMRLYHVDKVSKAFFQELHDRFAPYQTFASFYLWHASLEKQVIPFPKVK